MLNLSGEYCLWRNFTYKFFSSFFNILKGIQSNDVSCNIRDFPLLSNNRSKIKNKNKKFQRSNKLQRQ